MAKPLFRKSVSILLLNKNKELLIIRLPDKKGGGWKFPSGGADKSEKIEDTVIREIYEEIGTKKVRILAKSVHTHQYLWPKEALQGIKEKYGIPYEGQELTSFLVEYLGAHSDLVINEDELVEYRWVKAEDLKTYFTFDDQLDYTNKVLKDFAKFLHA